MRLALLLLIPLQKNANKRDKPLERDLIEARLYVSMGRICPKNGHRGCVATRPVE
jgi:hypothetical protein